MQNAYVPPIPAPQPPKLTSLSILIADQNVAAAQAKSLQKLRIKGEFIPYAGSWPALAQAAQAASSEWLLILPAYSVLDAEALKQAWALSLNKDWISTSQGPLSGLLPAFMPLILGSARPSLDQPCLVRREVFLELAALNPRSAAFYALRLFAKLAPKRVAHLTLPALAPQKAPLWKQAGLPQPLVNAGTNMRFNFSVAFAAGTFFGLKLALTKPLPGLTLFCASAFLLATLFGKEE